MYEITAPDAAAVYMWTHIRAFVCLYLLTQGARTYFQLYAYTSLSRTITDLPTIPDRRFYGKIGGKKATERRKFMWNGWNRLVHIHATCMHLHTHTNHLYIMRGKTHRSFQRKISIGILLYTLSRSCTCVLTNFPTLSPFPHHSFALLASRSMRTYVYTLHLYVEHWRCRCRRRQWRLRDLATEKNSEFCWIHTLYVRTCMCVYKPYFDIYCIDIHYRAHIKCLYTYWINCYTYLYICTAQRGNYVGFTCIVGEGSL